MKRFLCFAIAAAAISPICAGQFDFDSMDVKGDVDFNINTGRVNKVTQGASITLYDGSGAGMKIVAQSIVFDWPSDGEQPNSITLEGNVKIDQQQGTISAQKAVWTVSNDTIVFTGDPVFEGDAMRRGAGERIEINMRTGEARIIKSDLQGLQLGGGEKGAAPRSPGSLRSEDVTSWPNLLTALKAAAANAAPSPGGRILTFVDGRVKSALPGIDPAKEVPESNKGFILGELNGALRQSSLYTAEAWAGVAIEGEAQTLLQRGPDSLSPDEVVLLNRRLVEAAFPDAIAKAAN